MLYHNVRVMGSYLLLTDATAVGALSSASWWWGANAGLWGIETAPAMAWYTSTLIIAFVALGARLRAYHARRAGRLAEELLALLEVTLYASGLACLTSVLITRGLPGPVYLISVAVNSTGLLALRLVMRILIRHLRRGGNDYRVWLIVGRNRRAAHLTEAIVANPHFGIRLAAIVDLARKPDAAAPAGPTRLTPETSLGGLQPRMLHGLEEFRQIVAGTVIDEVVVTLPVRSYYDEVQAILDICCEAGISVKLPPQTFERGIYRTEVSQTGSIPMVTHFTGPWNHAHLAIKRAIDVVGAAIGLVLLLPVCIGIALAIRLDSPGPVLYRSTRVGLHGREFTLIKFRSMVKDAAAQKHVVEHLNETDGVAFKIHNDPRITRTGRVLRRFHLDELPQLWNVLSGDMSLVGPRPLPVEEAHGSEWWHRRRLSMPPGLTCFWQVSSDHHMPFREWAELDLRYIDRWSVWLDIKLIVSTLSTLVRGKGW